jgi:hypothetical protein
MATIVIRAAPPHTLAQRLLCATGAPVSCNLAPHHEGLEWSS